MTLGYKGLTANEAYLDLPEPTFRRVPINSIFGFIMRTYKKVSYGSVVKVECRSLGFGRSARLKALVIKAQQKTPKPTGTMKAYDILRTPPKHDVHHQIRQSKNSPKASQQSITIIPLIFLCYKGWGSVTLDPKRSDKPQTLNPKHP